MRRSQWADVLARRLNTDRGRIETLGHRAADAGLVPKTEGSRRYPPELTTGDALNLLLAVLTDDGLGKVAAQVEHFGSLTDDTGIDLHSALTDLLSHGPALAGAVTGALILRLDPASVALTAGGHFRRFGPEPPPGAAGKHVVVPGQTLAAIGLELQGRSPDEADALVALARVSGSATVGQAMHPRPGATR